MKDVQKIFVSLEQTIRDALKAIQGGGVELALIVDAERRLIGTISDGDVRRSVLNGIDVDDSVEKLLEERVHPYNEPTTARVGTSAEDLLETMREKKLRHIPVLDSENRVVDLAWISDLMEDVPLSMSAVVMAGGFGTRLHPLTENVPKPMLPVGEQPLLERTIAQLKEAGIQQVNLTTHYKKEVITEHFGNGEDFGVDIRYYEEDQPLGTAGALCLLEKQTEPLLIINGDIMTRIDFRAMLAFHEEHAADMTVAVRRYQLTIPFGVVEVDGIQVAGLTEKPEISHFINAGIYLLNPELCALVPKDQPYHMTDLIAAAISEERRVICFPVHESWLDIGEHEDYERAQVLLNDGKDD